jgi:hypothetical protein
VGVHGEASLLAARLRFPSRGDRCWPNRSARSRLATAAGRVQRVLVSRVRMQAWYDASRMRARADEISVERYQPA